ncbi:cytochrome P450 [Clavulina sp. PMI_390]|nr:cytochrome P450 [Clavulina sp. PMI_390]
MASRLPPGIPHLLELVPRVLAGPFVVLVVLAFLDRTESFHPSTWLQFLLIAIANPVLSITQGWWIDFSYQRQSRNHHAVLPPKMKSRLPGGFDLISAMLKSRKEDYVGDWLNRAHEAYGKTFMMNVGDYRIMTVEPAHIKQMLATNFSNYGKARILGPPTRSVIGYGIFNTDGDTWKYHRALDKPFFARDRISDFEIIERHTNELLSIMKERFRKGIPVDVQDLYARFTIDSATEFLFGKCVNSLHDPITLPGGIEDTSPRKSGSAVAPDAGRFVQAYTLAMEQFSSRFSAGKHWPLLNILEDRATKPMSTVYAYIDPIIASARQRRDQRSGTRDVHQKAEDDMSFIDYLLLQTDDPTVIRDSLMILLVAGRDTTATLLSFATYFFSQHPEVLAKARAEVLRVVGPSNAPTYNDIRELKYLRAVINETLRLFPSAPIVFRSAAKADVLVTPGGPGFYVPAGTAVGTSLVQLHRDPDLWGPDALEFDPMRWIDERRTRVTANPFIYLPFGAGPRICIGQQFALNEASFFLARLLQTFSSVTLTPEAQPPNTLPNTSGRWDLSRGRNGVEKVWPNLRATIYAEGGIWAVLGEAKFDNVA